MDDFLVLSYLSPNIESRLGFRSEFNKRLFDSVDIDEILNNDSEDTFYKTVVMNYLLKNGDAHLKNFGVLYDNSFTKIWFAPAYDIVNTVAYIYRDKPALMMFGKKVWWGREELIEFGVKHCFFSKSEAQKLYSNCFDALKISIKELEEVIKEDKNFSSIGQKMLDCWRLSLDEKTYKEMPLETIRHWN
jgi:serine/threonine-protein kinase HipA